MSRRDHDSKLTLKITPPTSIHLSSTLRTLTACAPRGAHICTFALSASSDKPRLATSIYPW